MANEVFANGREVACKAGDAKSICEFPDVCFTPPQTPATPPGVPIPYPNTGMSTDTTKGSKKVKISNKEVMLKNKSYYKKSMGDEAGCAPKKGIITSTTRGKVYFISWSFDVKFEGKNVDRQLDMTTHNHNPSVGTGSVPTVDVDGMAPPAMVDCDEVKVRFPVESYNEQKKKKGPPYDGCQSHHVIQNSHLQYPRGTTLSEVCPGYSEGAAPCIPLDDGTDTSTAHGRVSQMQKGDAKSHRKAYRENDKSPTYKDARDDAKKQLTAKNPGPGLSEGEAECVLIEVDKKFAEMCPEGMKDPSKFKLRPPGQRGKGLPKTSDTGGGAGGGM
ncbi:MAG: DUF4150 domain-containing protein [Candidatus Thiodiazotropha sp. (ex Dulcina madagascariensis)]|nr:DUF4150 domain-containing protein [Candidatus Thiodiazotropha sp. (ex Epidulcina cf. delphinae)]MCU7922978.1 DUF4150 domain-containing protein [Candidatus Thiodiazotropha sp. (ex Dulcina madagascariensis)]MCU7927604.1 DUF4150 domain-containing protein [Candidatus Thiodiazotropha sp. (ex Dulcina madagascariensis)]